MANNRYIQYPYNGQVRIKEVATTTTCDQRQAITVDEWNTLPLLSSLQAPSNHTLETLSCGVDTEVVFDPDFQDNTETPNVKSGIVRYYTVP